MWTLERERELTTNPICQESAKVYTVSAMAGNDSVLWVGGVMFKWIYVEVANRVFILSRGVRVGVWFPIKSMLINLVKYDEGVLDVFEKVMGHSEREGIIGQKFVRFPLRMF